MKPTLLFLAIIILANAGAVRADPLLFGNVSAVQNGSTRVDLFSNPGTILLGPRITFLVDITGTLPTAGTDTLQVTSPSRTASCNSAVSNPVLRHDTAPSHPGVQHYVSRGHSPGDTGNINIGSSE